jgi:large subunit ribosomal protein L35Ae
MQAIILSNRRGVRTQYNNQYILKIEDDKYTDKKTVSQLLGKKAIFNTSSGKKITGTIVSAHGNKGAVRAIFEKGLPGTAISQKVDIK